MKKSLLAFLGCLTLTAASLAGCSSSKLNHHGLH